MGMAPMIISAVLSMASSLSQGYAQANNQRNEAKMAEFNAQMAERNAAMAANEGKIEQGRAAEEAYKARGRQAASLAQAGILESATGEVLQDERKRKAQEEQLSIQRKSGQATEGLLSEAHNQRQRAKMLRGNAKQSILGGWLGGAESVARKFG